MLLLLMPDQIPRYWDEIREGLDKALPPGMPDRNAKILSGLQIGYVQCWISYHKENKTVVDGVLVTGILEDQIHQTRNLILYALWAIEGTHKAAWDEGMEALKKFAASKGCNRVIGYADSELVIGLCKATGGEARYTFCTWDV